MTSSEMIVFFPRFKVTENEKCFDISLNLFRRFYLQSRWKIRWKTSV